MNKETVQYKYIIKWGEETKEINLELTPDRMKIAPRHLKREDLPDWVDLNFQKCNICPLDSKKQPSCPAALSILDIVEEFSDVPSTIDVKLKIITPERVLIKKTQIAEALSSLIELCLWLSECPVLSQFSSMARFHLPFSSKEEAIFRITASYLLKQYFVDKNGGSPDWDLKGLKKFYDKIAIINGKLAERVRAGSCKDAGVNAVVRLDSFAKNFEYLFENSMEILENIFK
ncbi:MAG: DUF6901 family protein [Elusimicrobiota bacterium]